MKTLMIFDGNNLAHRARHAFNLSNAGQDVSVLYGFLRVMFSNIVKFDANTVVVAWDAGIPEFRREKLPSYKANRDRSDDGSYQDFLEQIKELDKVLPTFGVYSVRFPKIEADDIMYHLAFLTKNLYDEIIVVSGDEDMMQVTQIGAHVKVFNKEIRTRQTIREEYGIDPSQFIHWRALQGDSSDNIAGVSGIGAKTATKLFNEYDSISGIFNAAMGSNPVGKITGKIGQRILEFGMEQFSKNVYVMALAFDRTGVRNRLVHYFQETVWMPFSKDIAKRYFMKHAFASLMDANYYSAMAQLDELTPIYDVYRTPLKVASQRMPV